MVSIVLVTTDGISIEVGTVGKEGFVGIPILLGADISDRDIFSQVPGHGWSMRTDDFRTALDDDLELRLLCQRFTLIEHSRGSIRILDRKAMEQVTCACYEEVKQYFQQTMGFFRRAGFAYATST